MQGLVMRTSSQDPDLRQGPVQNLVLCPGRDRNLHLRHALIHHPNLDQDPGLSPVPDPGLDPDHDHILKRMMNIDLMISEMMKQKKQSLVKRKMKKLKMNKNQKEKI